MSTRHATPPSSTSRLWSCRWPALRLALAAFIIWVFAADSAARLARLQLASLPGFDYAAEVRSLTEQGRFGEAQTIAEAGERDPDADHTALAEAKAAAITERDSTLRLLKDAGVGALTGRADSLEGLVGAVATDLFVVGDIRDLLIEGGRLVLDGETDELILALSVAGIVTTLAPEIDWVPSLLKVARKSGTLSAKFAESLLKLLKSSDSAAIRQVFETGATISKKTSPGGYLRLLRHIDDPADAAKFAKFIDAVPDAGAAIHITGDAGAAVLKNGWKVAEKSGPDAALAAEKLVTKAARKGAAGSAFLKTPAAKALLRPHPLIGLAKALWKGNAEKLLIELASRTDAKVWWILPLAGAWALLELVTIAGRLLPRKVLLHAAQPQAPTRRFA